MVSKTIAWFMSLVDTLTSWLTKPLSKLYHWCLIPCWNDPQIFLSEKPSTFVDSPDSKVRHGVNMGPTWVLSAPDGPHVGPMNLAIRECALNSLFSLKLILKHKLAINQWWTFHNEQHPVNGAMKSLTSQPKWSQKHRMVKEIKHMLLHAKVFRKNMKIYWLGLWRNWTFGPGPLKIQWSPCEIFMRVQCTTQNWRICIWCTWKFTWWGPLDSWQNCLLWALFAFSIISWYCKNASNWNPFHNVDVIMSTVAAQITSRTIVYSTVYSGADQGNIKALRHWPLCGEFTGDRWIPLTNGQ